MDPEIPIEIIQQCKLQDEMFEGYVEELKKISEATKDWLLKVEPFMLNTIWAANSLTMAYSNIAFFPDPEIFDGLYKLGIKKKDLLWITPIEEIRTQFKRLDEIGILIYKHEFLSGLKVHLTVQISLDVYNWSEVLTETKKGSEVTGYMSQAERALRRHKRSSRKKNEASKEKKLANAIANEISATEKDSGIKKNTILRLAKGEIEKDFYLRWLQDSFPYSDEILKSNKFLQDLLPLFKLIFRNNPVPELEDIGDLQYQGKSLESIQSQFLRKWIFKK